MLLLDKVSTVGVSESRRVGHKGITDHTVDIKLNSQGAALISGCVVVLQGSLTNEDNVNGLITNPTLVTGTTAERVANSAFDYIIAGVSYTKGAVAAGTQFTVGAMLDGLAPTPAIGDYSITNAKYGGFMVYINSSGTIGWKAPLATQAYASIALANTALEAIATPAGYIPICKMLMYGNENPGAAGKWTPDTDDLTTGNDITTVVYANINSSFHEMQEYTLNATELANHRAIFSVKEMGTDYIRVYLKTLTGTGEVSVKYLPLKWRNK